MAELATEWRRNEHCVEAWPQCFSGGYDPRCCRFPKSCSCMEPVPSEEIKVSVVPEEPVENEVPLVVKIKTLDERTPEVVTRIASFAAIGLNRMFGIDRFEIWYEGKRFTWDPVAHDEGVDKNPAGKWVGQ